MKPYLVWHLACGCAWHGTPERLHVGMAWECRKHGTTNVRRIQPTKAEQRAAA